MIQEYKKEGKLVPSDIVVELLQQAMQRSGNKKFLLDGFPRNEENRVAAEKIVSCFIGSSVQFCALNCLVLFYADPLEKWAAENSAHCSISA